MKYSIITPVYNRQDCIARCLDSVIRNLASGCELEHIVVDDGSTDGTDAIIETYEKSYKHINFFRFDCNRGTNAARNAAIAAAKGEFCIILDSDDYFVDNAIQIINDVVSAQDYKHYCFAANDMLDYYESNPILGKSEQTVLDFNDFLLERVSGDFIHVIKTETLRKYPFDEALRIYEGVFFKRFYREAGKILFTRKVVTIRERGRSDSVTLDVILKNKARALKGLDSKLLLVEWFEPELLRSDEGRIILHKTYSSIVELYLLLRNYRAAENWITKIGNLGVGKVPLILRIVKKSRLGGLYFFARKIYSLLKFDMLRSRIR